MGFKPMTFRTGIWRSIQLSYGAFMQCKNTLFRWRGQMILLFISAESMPLRFFLRGRGMCITLSLLSLFKRPVTFRKTTRHFWENNPSFFYRILHRSKKNFPLVADRTQSFFRLTHFSILRVQTFLKTNLLAHAYARIHNRSFCFFAVTSVTVYS